METFLKAEKEQKKIFYFVPLFIINRFYKRNKIFAQKIFNIAAPQASVCRSRIALGSGSDGFTVPALMIQSKYYSTGTDLL
jgi:hypothetical protein